MGQTIGDNANKIKDRCFIQDQRNRTTTTMTIGKMINNNMRVQTDETGQIIDKIFANDLESVDDAQSVTDGRRRNDR